MRGYLTHKAVEGGYIKNVVVEGDPRGAILPK